LRFAFVAVLVVAVSCTSTAPAAPSATDIAATATEPPPSAPPPTPKPAPIIGWTYEGTVRENAVDARDLILPDGSYRQVFSRFRSFQPGPEGNGIGAYYVTAISKDGLHWTDEGESSLGYFIPVRLPDGTYRAFASGRLTLYSSTDGMSWKPGGRISPPEAGNPKCGTTSGMFSDVVALPDGALRAYYNCIVATFSNIPATEVKSATSKDGLVWQIDPGVRINPLDGPEVRRDDDGHVDTGAAEHPRVVRLPDGTLKMFYGSLNGSGLWSATSSDGLAWTNRHFEGVRGGDPDVIVLPDGRLRVFVNGTVGLPSEFGGKSPGENSSRMVSYVYGPTNYRVGVPLLRTECSPCAVGAPPHFTVTIEGSGPRVTLGAVGYDQAAAFDLVNGSDTRAKVSFTPSSGSPPFTADATISFGVPDAHQFDILAAGVVVVADDGTTKVVTAVLWSRGSPPPVGPCQLGSDIPVVGCYVAGSTGPDGKPLMCVPVRDRQQPPACGPYLPPDTLKGVPPCQFDAAVPVDGCYVKGSSGPDGSPLVCVPLAARELKLQPPVCGPYLVPVH